jgi:hypothetical protein
LQYNKIEEEIKSPQYNIALLYIIICTYDRIHSEVESRLVGSTKEGKKIEEIKIALTLQYYIILYIK